MTRNSIITVVKRVISIGSVALGITLVAFAATWLYFGNPAGRPTSDLLPDSIAGLQINTYTTGNRAVTEFESLHGKQFPVTTGAIGTYGDRAITLWAAGAPSEAIALEMTIAMREKIAEGNSPFTPLTEIVDNNRSVYVLEGMGQKHYYFRSKNMVIWLAVDPSIAAEALEQILEAYP